MEHSIGSTDLRQKLTDVLRAVREERATYVVETFGRSQAALVNVDDYHLFLQFCQHREAFLAWLEEAAPDGDEGLGRPVAGGHREPSPPVRYEVSRAYPVAAGGAVIDDEGRVELDPGTREALGIPSGTRLDVDLQPDGTLALRRADAGSTVRLEERDGLLIAVASDEAETMSLAEVDALRRRLRRNRGSGSDER